MVAAPPLDPEQEAHASKLLRLRRQLTVAIGTVGAISALLIYILATHPSAEVLESELESKTYLRDMEIYGGKWNILAKEFREWFAGLWHGQALAFTVVVITVLLVLALRIITTPVPPNAGS